MSVPMPQVFISYQRTDGDFAQRVRERLVAAGVRTWMDHYDIPFGAYWPDAIDAGLTASDIVVGILSPDAIDSRNVKNEWDWAIQNDKRLLLVQVQPATIPHRYVSINFIDATTDAHRALDALVDALGVEIPRIGEVIDPSTPMSMNSDAPQVERHYPDVPLLVGREREQMQFAEPLDRLAAGRGALVLLGGEAGIGKTTLTSWFAWAAEEQGALVLVGGCYDLSTTPPYGPWVEITRGWPEDSDLPSLPRELRPGTGLASVSSQSALFDLVVRLLSEASMARPLVLVLEDLHWADQASLDLLRYLAHVVEAWPLLLVVTYRDDEITRRHPLFALLPTLAREPHTLRLTLMRLDPSALDALVTCRYDLPPAEAARLTSYLHDHTEGNPFFASEVLRALEESGALERRLDTWRLARLDHIQVPTVVRQVIDGRLVRLGDDARQLLGIAAVIGHEVPLDLWVNVSGTDHDRLADVLERAIDAKVVEEARAGDHLRFTHALVRETLYEGLVSLRRRAWHRQVAEALMGVPGSATDTVAHHLQQGGDPRAFDWLVRAGEQARLAYAWHDAIDRYERAISLIADDQARTQERGWLHLRIGVLRRATDAHAGLRHVTAALEAARSTGDRTLETYATHLLGVLHAVAAEYETALSYVRAAGVLGQALTQDHLAASGPLLTSPFADVERIDPAWVDEYLTYNAMRGIEVMLFGAYGHFRWAIDVGEPFVASATIDALPTPAIHAVSDACCGLALSHAALGDPERGLHYVRRAIDGYVRIGHFLLQLNFARWYFTSVCWRYSPDDPPVRDYLQHVATQAEHRLLGAVGASAGYAFADYVAALYTDRWDDVIAYWETGPLARTGGRQDVAPVQMGEIARWRGQVHAARTAIAGVDPAEIDGALFIGSFLDTEPLIRFGATLHLDAADVDGARSWLQAHDRFLERSEATLGRSDGALLWARYHRIAGDLVSARDQAQRAVAHARNPRQPFALLSAHRFLGELLIERGDLDAAAAHLQSSLDLAGRIGIRSEIAWTQLVLAELHGARGEAETARALLTEVRTVFESLRAVPTLQRAAMLESRL